MNIFIDCEFNGFGGDLISMALVADDGEEFYEVVDLQNDRGYETWVLNNVVPILYQDSISPRLFIDKLYQFLAQYESVHIIADWPDDIKYFCQALITGPGRAITTPPITLEIDRRLSAEKSKILHNALEDAKAIRQHHRLLNDG